MKSINQTIKNIKRYPMQSIQMFLMLFSMFLLIYIFLFILLVFQIILSHFESIPQVFAFFKLNTSDQYIQEIAQELKQKPYVKSIKIISKEEAFKIYSKSHQDNPMLLELVSADILPASIEVSAKDLDSLEKIYNDLKDRPEIETITFQKDVVSKIREWVKSLRLIGIFIISLLSFVSFMITISTVSLKFINLRRSIFIKKLIGATDFFIILPFLYESFLLTFLASLTSWGIVFLLTTYFSDVISRIFVNIVSFPIDYRYYLLMFAFSTVFYILISMIASIFTVKRLLNKRVL